MRKLNSTCYSLRTGVAHQPVCAIRSTVLRNRACFDSLFTGLFAGFTDQAKSPNTTGAVSAAILRSKQHGIS